MQYVPARLLSEGGQDPDNEWVKGGSEFRQRQFDVADSGDALSYERHFNEPTRESLHPMPFLNEPSHVLFSIAVEDIGGTVT